MNKIVFERKKNCIYNIELYKCVLWSERARAHAHSCMRSFVCQINREVLNEQQRIKAVGLLVFLFLLNGEKKIAWFVAVSSLIRLCHFISESLAFFLLTFSETKAGRTHIANVWSNRKNTCSFHSIYSSIETS